MGMFTTFKWFFLVRFSFLTYWFISLFYIFFWWKSFIKEYLTAWMSLSKNRILILLIYVDLFINFLFCTIFIAFFEFFGVALVFVVLFIFFVWHNWSFILIFHFWSFFPRFIFLYLCNHITIWCYWLVKLRRSIWLQSLKLRRFIGFQRLVKLRR